MKYLLDTHAFLWFILDDTQLSSTARALIIDEQNDFYLSPASYWELAIKISIGKYQLPGPFVPFLHQQIDLNDFVILPISAEHAGKVASLPYHHRDPFDRMIIAQALVEGMSVLSNDSVMDHYGVNRSW